MNRRNFLAGLLAISTIAVLPSFPISPIHKAVSLDEIMATTLKEYRSVLINNITTYSPRFQQLKERGLIK